MSVAKLAFAGAALVSSSALRQAYEGTMPLETAATRFAIVLAVSWIALSLVAELVFPGASAAPALSPAAALPESVNVPEGETERLEDHPSPAPPTSMPNP